MKKHIIELGTQKFEYEISDEELIELRFTGKNINPQNISAKDVAKIISEFENALYNIAIRKNPEIKKEELYLGLVNIKDRSAGYGFIPKIRDPFFFSFLLLTTSINQSDYRHLPIKSIESLQALSDFSKKNRCNTHFKLNGTVDKRLATITPDDDINIPDELFLTGNTTIYGNVQRVGGVEPTVAIKPHNQEKVLYSPIRHDLAKRLAEKLYEWVQLSGTATWQVEDNLIIDFKISELLDYEPRSNKGSFSELRELLGRHWDEIDDIDKELSRE